MLNRNILGLVCAAIFMMVGCKSAEQKNHLLGKWQVKSYYRDGQDLAGPGFHGSQYVFQENGMVKSVTHSGDTTEVPYRHSGDSLFWVTMDQSVLYMIDSLGPEFMRLLMDQDGMQTEVQLKKLKVD